MGNELTGAVTREFPAAVQRDALPSAACNGSRAGARQHLQISCDEDSDEREFLEAIGERCGRAAADAVPSASCRDRPTRTSANYCAVDATDEQACTSAPLSPTSSLGGASFSTVSATASVAASMRLTPTRPAVPFGEFLRREVGVQTARVRFLAGKPQLATGSFCPVRPSAEDDHAHVEALETLEHLGAEGVSSAEAAQGSIEKLEATLTKARAERASLQANIAEQRRQRDALEQQYLCLESEAHAKNSALVVIRRALVKRLEMAPAQQQHCLASSLGDTSEVFQQCLVELDAQIASRDARIMCLEGEIRHLKYPFPCI